MKSIAATTLMCGLLTVSEAFVTPNTGLIASAVPKSASRLFEATLPADPVEEDDDPRNPDYPNLPEVKGDFDWDAKFGGDDDWITENVPGKIVLDEITLAKQVTSLNKLEEQFRKERFQREVDDFEVTGWVGNAELLNSRFAMFFLAVGLFTESFTGISIPGQVEEMLRILGFIGFD